MVDTSIWNLDKASTIDISSYRIPLSISSDIDATKYLEPADILADWAKYAANDTVNLNGNSLVNAVIDGTNNTISNIDETMMVVDTGTLGQVLTSNGDGSAPTYQNTSGDGDVVGPSSATNDSVVRWDGTTGKLVKDSAVQIDDAQNVIGINDIDFTDGSTQNRGSTPDDMLAVAGTAIEQKKLDIADVNGSETNVGGMTMSHDGEFLFVIGITTQNLFRVANIAQYEIDDSGSPTSQTADVSLTNYLSVDIKFKDDGLRGYLGYRENGAATSRVRQFDLTTAYDLTTIDTGSYVDYDTTSFEDLQGISLSPDGKQIVMVASDTSNEGLYEYSLDTPWDLSTLDEASEKYNDLDALSTNPRGVHFRIDGTMMHLCDRTNDAIQTYRLPQPWNITTLELLDTFDLSAIENNPTGVFANPGATRLFISGNQLDGVDQLALGLQIEGALKKVIFNEEMRINRRADTGLTITPLITDYLIGCQATGARTVTIPTALVGVENMTLLIKDEAGTAGTSAITINTEGSEKIDGENSVSINANDGIVRLYTNGQNWYSW